MYFNFKYVVSFSNFRYHSCIFHFLQPPPNHMMMNNGQGPMGMGPPFGPPPGMGPQGGPGGPPPGMMGVISIYILPISH